MFNRDKLEIPLGDYPPKGVPFTAMRSTSRLDVIDLLDETKKLHGIDGYFEITMPCGYSQVFSEPSNVPLKDLPCPCGQEGRYLIRYKKE